MGNPIDDFFDKAEAIVGGMENVFKTHPWTMEEILDAEGKEPPQWEVTDGEKIFKTEKKEHAEWLVERLS